MMALPSVAINSWQSSLAAAAVHGIRLR